MSTQTTKKAQKKLPELVYSSDSEGFEEPKNKPKLRPAVEAFQMWQALQSGDLTLEEHAVRIYTLSPFMYGQTCQPDDWTSMAQEVKLLPPDGEITNINNNIHFENIDLICESLDLILKFVHEDKGNILRILDVIEKCNKQKPELRTNVALKENSLPFKKWRKKLECTDEKKANMALLFVCRQYADHVHSLKEGKSKAKEFKQTCTANKIAEEIKLQGNTEFQAKNFGKAVSLYTRAIYQCPYNHIYYGNRAQAHLKKSEYQSALSDGKRAIMLQPDWAKGHYRYVEALSNLGRLDDARKAIKVGLQYCCTDSHLIEQNDRLSKKEKEKEKEKDTTDVPPKKERTSAATVASIQKKARDIVNILTQDDPPSSPAKKQPPTSKASTAKATTAKASAAKPKHKPAISESDVPDLVTDSDADDSSEDDSEESTTGKKDSNKKKTNKAVGATKKKKVPTATLR